MESGRTAALIKQDMGDGMKYGVNGTPTFFVNRCMVVGLSGLEKAVSEEVSRPLK